MSKWHVFNLVEQALNIEGYPNHFFGNDGKLYRITIRGEVRQNKRLVRVGELKKANSRVTFVVAKRQRDDQTVY